MAFPRIELVSTRAQYTIQKVPKANGSRHKESSLWMISAAYPLWRLDGALGGLVKVLSTELGSISMDETKRLAHLTSQLYGKIARMLSLYEKASASQSLLFRSTLKSIAAKNDHLSNIVEGLYMALDEDFQDFIENTVSELEQSGSARSSLIASM